MISTDNHIGFMERDPVRGSDSFLAFEEVLATARAKGVDLVLLAGDLFHENKPSRYTLWRYVDGDGTGSGLRGSRRAWASPPCSPPSPHTPFPLPPSRLRAARWRSSAST
jgi:hypothetical protein